MSAGGETRAGYAATDLTGGPHLLTHFRPQLKRDGVHTAMELKQLPNGKRVATAGAIIVRQRPGTAKGFVFLTLEDETGISQAIVKPDLFREHRALIVGSPGLIVEGILQNPAGQCSVRADKFWTLEGTGAVVRHAFHEYGTDRWRPRRGGRRRHAAEPPPPHHSLVTQRRRQPPIRRRDAA